MANLPTLPDDVLAAFSRGETIEALKRLRAATGLGLQEAKYLLDQYQQQAQSRRTVENRAGGAAVPASVREALAAGNKIEAIRLYRQHSGAGLKKAKDVIDELERRGGFYNPSLAPGEVSSGSNRWLGMLIVFVVLCAIGYALFF